MYIYIHFIICLYKPPSYSFIDFQHRFTDLVTYAEKWKGLEITRDKK